MTNTHQKQKKVTKITNLYTKWRWLIRKFPEKKAIPIKLN